MGITFFIGGYPIIDAKIELKLKALNIVLRLILNSILSFFILKF